MRCVILAACAAALLGLPTVAAAQGSQPKAGDKQPPAAAGPNKEVKKIDEFAEAARVLGGPAANPECVWLGRRVVNLLWRDDLDTAFRHLTMYDRFGCPSAHVQAAFRCLVRQGDLDPKASDILNARVHDCWLDPNLQPKPAAPAPAAAAPAAKPPAK
jgi:hypothetical protein